MTHLQLAPFSAIENKQPRFGRYEGFIHSPNFGRDLRGRLRLKRWHYLSAESEEWFVALAVVHLGYAASHFVYLVEKSKAHRVLEGDGVHPPFALRFAGQPTSGVTEMKSGSDHIRIEPAQGGFCVTLDVTIGKSNGRKQARRLSGTLTMFDAEPMSLLFELPKSQPAYTAKCAGLKAEGELLFGDKALDFSNSLATYDWTRSLAQRNTRWKWAAMSQRNKDGNRLGLNLSSDVYDTDGASQENTLWVAKKPIALPGVNFVVPRNPGVDEWHIHSKSGDEIDIHFEPAGVRAKNFQVGPFGSDFVQPYGRFFGSVLGHEIDGFGVVEDHHARW